MVGELVTALLELRVGHASFAGDQGLALGNRIDRGLDRRAVLTVPDGETIAMGGLVAATEISERLGLPLLMDLPLIGSLFGSTTKRKSTTELVFFITLTIVRPWDSREVAPVGPLGEAE